MYRSSAEATPFLATCLCRFVPAVDKFGSTGISFLPTSVQKNETTSENTCIFAMIRFFSLQIISTVKSRILKLISTFLRISYAPLRLK